MAEAMPQENNQISPNTIYIAPADQSVSVLLN